MVAERVADCAWRIEDKYSRYRRGNVIDEINTAGGRAVTVDEETAKLLDFAATLHDLSDGLFDVTSGVLRRAWTFDGGTRVPTQAEIDALLPLVGWDKVQWSRPKLRLPPGMQLDFGGIGKEYAVDQAVQIARNICSRGALVNFGGDLAVSRPRADGRPWRVGIENPAVRARAASRVLDLRHGALATSGDTHRFVLADGTRYSHILNPRSGWPVSERATLGDGCRRHLYSCRNADDPRGAGRKGRRAVPGRRTCSPLGDSPLNVARPFPRRRSPAIIASLPAAHDRYARPQRRPRSKPRRQPLLAAQPDRIWPRAFRSEATNTLRDRPRSVLRGQCLSAAATQMPTLRRTRRATTA